MRSGFFNSEIIGTDSNNMPIFDRAESADFWAEYFKRFIGNGVYSNPASSFQILENSGLSLTVKAGSCFINGYFAFDSSDTVITLADSNILLPRIDRIVARLDMTQREITIAVLTGTPSSAPVAPDLTRNSTVYELALADVTVEAAATSVSQLNITDLRPNSSYCGFVSGVISQIDTTGLFAQYQSEFDSWFSSLKNAVDENDVAAFAATLNEHTSNSSIHLSEEDKAVISNPNLMFSNVAQTMSAALFALNDSNYSVSRTRNIALLNSVPTSIPNGAIAAVYS